MKRALILGGLVGVLCALVLSSAMAAENVTEAWRSAYGTPYAVAVSPSDGSLWAATGNSVMHVAVNGTVQSQTNGFLHPQGLAVNSDDSTVWVADTGHNQMVKLNGDGTEALRVDGFAGPTSVAVDAGSYGPAVWVADTGHNAVAKLNPATGAQLWRSATDQFSNPRGLSVSQTSGDVWVADTGHNQVVQINSNGTEEAGRRFSGFTGPLSVSVEDNDWYPVIWVADTGANRIVQLDKDGVVTTTTTGFLSPQAVATVPDNNSVAEATCWALDTGHHQVVHLGADGKAIWRGGTFDTPTALAINPNDNSPWIGDTARMDITHLAAAGTLLKQVSLITTVAKAVATAPDNTVWIATQGAWDNAKAEYSNCFVQHLGLNGESLAKSGTDVYLQDPNDIAVDPADGSVWVTDARVDKVYHLSSAGAKLWESATTPDYQFDNPVAVIVHPTTHEAWIVNNVSSGSQTTIWKLSGSTHATLATVSGLDYPNAIAMDNSDGSVWISCSSLDQVIHADSTGALTGELFDAGGDLNSPTSVGVDQRDGTLWVGAYDALYHVTANGETIIWQSAEYDGGTDMWVNATDGSVALLGWSYPFVVSSTGTLIWTDTDMGRECITLCPDGSFWLGDTDKKMVRHLAPDGMVVKQFSGFRAPQSVSVRESDSSGWVADASGLGAVHLSSARATLATVAVAQAVGLAVNQADGSVWVANRSNNTMLHLDATGAAMAGSPVTGFTGISAGAANSHDSSVWVGDTANLVHVSSAGVKGTTVTGFTKVDGVDVDPGDDSVWVVDGSANKVAHLKGSDGSVLWSSTSFPGATAVAVNKTDHSVWVLTEGDGKLWHLKGSDGSTLWSGTGFSGGSLAVNWQDGTVWVADGDGGVVVHLKADGTELWRGTEYASPSSVSVSTGDGAVWVCDAGLAQVVRLVVAPTADFSADKQNGPPPLTVQFTDQSTGTPTAWSWTFGDTTNNTSTAQNPSHTYSNIGAYTVALTVTSVVGTDTETKQNYINASNTPAPVADFSADKTTGNAPLAVQFTDLSSNTPSAWAWVFGDNGTTVGATTKNPTHTYAANGSYTVSLTATNAGGSNTKVRSNYIVVGASTADFSAVPTAGIATPTTALSVAFTDLSANSPTAWSWNFGDPKSGANNTSTQKNPTHAYASQGTYAVTLTATGAGGAATVTKQHYILVSFSDVPVSPAFWALKQVLACVDGKVVTGYSDGTYRPAVSVTRDQMAVYISRALAGGDAGLASYTPPTTPSFTDVATDSWAYKYVEYAVSKKVVTGYSDHTYRPTVVVTRDQMAVYISRSVVDPTGDEGLASYTPPTTASFADVPVGFWAYKYIEYAKAQDIVKGYSDGYRPTVEVTRDQMAVYVARAFELPTAP